jgi:excisionase family DNA binding protein
MNHEELKFDELPEAVSEIKATVNGIAKMLNNHPSFKDEVEDKLLTIDEASKYTSLARQTIYGMVSSRSIPFCKRKGTKRLYFSRNDLKEWIMSGRKKVRK